MSHHFTRRTYHNISAMAQCFFLLDKSITVSAAVNGYGAYRAKIRKAFHVLRYLHRKFAGWYNDQCIIRMVFVGVSYDLIDEG